MGKRTHDFAFVSLCYRGSGEDICTGYAMAASGRMQYDYKQTNADSHIFLWDGHPVLTADLPTLSAGTVCT
jgi:hypothetical protein